MGCLDGGCHNREDRRREPLAVVTPLALARAGPGFVGHARSQKTPSNVFRNQLVTIPHRITTEMYTAFYGLFEKPFSLSPDPRYLFFADSHREALAHLIGGFRATVEIALTFELAHFLERFEDVLVLDTLGRDRQVETAVQSTIDCRHNSQIWGASARGTPPQ